MQELPGTRLDFQFHAVKLLDLDEDALIAAAQGGNPAALMLLAFRKAMAAEQDVALRFEARKQLIALMMEYGYNEDAQAHLLRLLEWVLMLPEVLEQQVEQLVEAYKREHRTSFVSRLERRAIREGLEQGREAVVNGLMRLLFRRFGTEAETVRADLEQIVLLPLLESLFESVLDAPSLDDFRARVQEVLAQQAKELENGQNRATDGDSSPRTE